MRIAIACVGRLKERYWKEAAAEYVKRLSRYAQTEILETDDESVPERLSDAQRATAIAKEGDRLLAFVQSRDIVIALCIDGKRLTSENFAKEIESGFATGAPRIVFVIGGSLGLSPAVTSRANIRLSLSDMTFPHQLARVLLLEQIYRAFKILNNETYHK